MNIKILRELEPYTIPELLNIFNTDEDGLKEILDSLVLMNITKRISKDISDIELEDLLETENLSELNDIISGRSYVFKYVGIVVVSNICLIIYPKYVQNYKLDKDNNYTILRQFIEVIRKYQYKEQSFGFSDETITNNFNLLSLALELLKYYFEHGLYINEKEIIEENGDGEILWDKTINEKTAYFSDNTPVYLDIFSSNRENNQNDYFTNLHSYVLTEVSNRIHGVLKLLDLNPVLLNYSELEDFGNKEHILYRLNQEISTQFITYKQNTLKLLRRYVEEKYSRENSKDVSFIGTSNFNLVWEDVCSVVLDNSIKKSIKELGLKYSKNNKESILISDIIAKPKWEHKKSGEIHTSNKTLTPDIVSINQDQLSIYDAKYYKIILNEKEVKKHPGVNDVIKQYLYEMAYIDFANENRLYIKNNSFLVPTDKEFVENIGSVSIDLFSYDEYNYKSVDVILLPHKKMYEYYLKNDSILDIEELL